MLQALDPLGSSIDLAPALAAARRPDRRRGHRTPVRRVRSGRRGSSSATCPSPESCCKPAPAAGTRHVSPRRVHDRPRHAPGLWCGLIHRWTSGWQSRTVHRPTSHAEASRARRQVRHLLHLCPVQHQGRPRGLPEGDRVRPLPVQGFPTRSSAIRLRKAKQVPVIPRHLMGIGSRSCTTSPSSVPTWILLASWPSISARAHRHDRR